MRTVTRTTFGTPYFVNRAAASSYYKSQAYDDAAATVDAMLAAGEIHLGVPPNVNLFDLVLLDSGRRWGIHMVDHNFTEDK